MLPLFTWWAAMLVLGMAVLPMTQALFGHFTDRGWIFAKTLGLFLLSWILWVLNILRAVRFSQAGVMLVLVLLAGVNYRGAFHFQKEEEGHRRYALIHLDRQMIRLCVVEEVLFLGLFAAAVYIIGFKPEAYGTEKFMDYAFLTSLARSTYMPFADPWFGGEPINYYYGGQYITGVLMRMCGTTAGESYNLMRGLITAMSFVLPFALVWQLMKDWCEGPVEGLRADAGAGGSGEGEKADAGVPGSGAWIPYLTAALSGIAVAFCGNFHYVLYGIVKPYLAARQGESYSYWFPNSTRFIGYDPDIPDKTIHEFPAYSSVLGDLHAHYVNILFVVTIVALVYAWAQGYVRRRAAAGSASGPGGLHADAAGRAARLRRALKGSRVAASVTRESLREVLRCILNPYAVLCGFMSGAFRWTNFWDFPIYYVVCGSIFFFVLLGTYRQRLWDFIVIMMGIALIMFAAGYVAALPFTMSFDQISSEVARTWSHTSFIQLAILWGLPAGCLLFFVISLICEMLSRRNAADTAKNANAAADGQAAGSQGVERNTAAPERGLLLPDLAVLMFALCAAGLVFLPEVIYVKDIYSETHYRANTMFKLTYQAFILFGICMPYILVRGLKLGKGGEKPEAGKRRGTAGIFVSRAAAFAGIVLLLLTGGYIFKSIDSWFGDVKDPANRINTDASVFISESFVSDFDAVNWINSNIGGQPVIVEAPGDSYTDYERISVATGLPTVVGWRVHEWLWRSDLEAVDRRIADVERIYTSPDSNEVRDLLDKYGVSYIYVGRLEYEKYPELQDGVLRDMGPIVYDDGETYIVEVE